jgi:hypothetical protein
VHAQGIPGSLRELRRVVQFVDRAEQWAQAVPDPEPDVTV